MHIAISGQTGFIGTELTNFFLSEGYTVSGIGREDFSKGKQHLADLLEGKDVLINLAGAPIIRRWTQKHKVSLWSSRIDTTQKLAEALSICRQAPGIFISGSGVNIYDNTHLHTEDSTHLSNDFLGKLCSAWEEQALAAQPFCKTYIIRSGVILGKKGGALPTMALPFRWFVGGKIGKGTQQLSWMHIDDYARAVHMLIKEKPENTLYNFCSPHPLTNAEFSRHLARTLKRSALFTVPPFAIKLLYGEGAVVVLTGQAVLPANLQKAGFEFQFPVAGPALENLLG